MRSILLPAVFAAALCGTVPGIAYGVPQPGSTMGVSDAVEFTIEAEFSGPAWKGHAAG